MKKEIRKKLLLTLTALVIASICLPSMAADPGSTEDPLVSLSYINDVLMPQIKNYVKTNAGTAQGAGATYELLELKAGKTIIGGQSCEFILRMGTAEIVATDKGGLADVTAGVDLKNKTAMPANHLLIVPFDDWRGIKMTSDGIVMVKGVYSIN